MPGLRAGAHIDNPGRARIATYEYLDHDERLPSVIRSGLAYQFSKGLQASLEVEKHIRYPARPESEWNTPMESASQCARD